jgi:hypothetical protein
MGTRQITAITAAGQRIEFGTGERLEKKLKIVQALVKQAEQRAEVWNVLDVRSTERPSIKR